MGSNLMIDESVISNEKYDHTIRKTSDHDSKYFKVQYDIDS